MKCPTLDELPRPENGALDQSFAAVPIIARNGLPRISVVIPSFNQGRYIEEALRSVLLQGYPDLELIVMDGGSSDQTVAMIRKYEKWIAHWVSAPDGGQSAAINEGFRRSTGEICAWIGCDDRYAPGALLQVGEIFDSEPDCAWLAGAGRLVFESGRRGEMRSRVDSLEHLLAFWRWCDDCFVMQPSSFWRRGLWNAAGGLRDDLHLAMDYDLWLRFAERAPLRSVDNVLSVALREAGGKTVERAGRQRLEAMRCAYEYSASRGRVAHALTCGLLGWYFYERLRRGKDHVVRGDLSAVARELGHLVAAPARVLHERGRLALLLH